MKNEENRKIKNIFEVDYFKKEDSQTFKLLFFFSSHV